MRCLIRFRSRTAGGTVSERDRIFDGDALTLGRATDQVLHLKDKLVALEHARIVKRGAQCVLSCRVVGGATVNGVPVQDARIVPGDVVQIGANILRFLDPLEGFDLVFSFELDPTAARSEAARQPARLRIGGGWLSARRWSWALFAAVLTLGLLLPASGVLSPGWQKQLRSSALPDDLAWLPGPLHVSHANLTTRCEVCHDGKFQHVRNESCLKCHGEGLRQHAHVDGRPVATLMAARCGSCHEEHQEPAQLIRRDQRFCADCHARLPQITGSSQQAEAVTDFGKLHPEFRVTMLRFDAANQPISEVRRSLADPALREPSALKFPHDKHLVRKGVKSPLGTVVMECGDCHQPEPGGARMRPIRMEDHCANCHRLDFDPANPEREMPHGDARAVWQSLREYYSARYLEGYPDPRATARSDRRAGQTPALSDGERARRLRLAQDQARLVGTDLFERRVCKTCHEIVRADLPDLPLAVKPVRLTQVWMPGAHFSHAAHSTAQSRCDHCHEAGTSRASTDVLMPKIGVCRECHAGGTHSVPADRVASSCTLCHSFHREREDPWRVAQKVP